MKRAVTIGILLLIGAAIGFLVATLRVNREVTLVSLSPDDRHRVHLVELRSFDRNFVLCLERLADQSFETVFRSPDEGRPVGSERIVWSPDSRQFVLLGRHFYVRKGTPSFGGELLYLLYDVKTGRLSCNASQQSAHPQFGSGDVEWLKIPDLAPLGEADPEPKAAN